MKKKNEKFQKKMFAFSYSCSKHRLWVHVITASSRRFKLVPTILCFGAKDKKKKIDIPLHTPVLLLMGYTFSMKCFPDVKCLNKNDFNDANACA